jgi:hypothetical protein
MIQLRRGWSYMQILVSIDDTDNLDSRGTGALASLLADGLEERGWGKSSFVTRHQLLLHQDIPYTSHNSAMCFAAEIQPHLLDKVIEYAADFLAGESAAGSDPGLCVAAIDSLKNRNLLIDFGSRAKQEVVTMAEAHAVAQEAGCHLSSHGGSGQGVIGALAGAGLRLGGNDGRLKGSLRMPAPAGRVSVAELMRCPEVDEIRTLSGEPLNGTEQVRLGDKVKTVMLAGKSVLLLEPVIGTGEVRWQTCAKQRLKCY